MRFTPEEENEIVARYESLIWDVVYDFYRDTGNPLITPEDLFQECVIVLLNRVRRMESADELTTNFPFKYMKGAMTRYIVASQTLRYPKTTTNAHKVIQKERDRNDISIDTSKPLMCCGSGLDDALTLIDFRAFVDELSEKERKIIKRKLQGAKNTEIARELGISDATIHRIIAQIRTKYAIHMSH